MESADSNNSLRFGHNYLIHSEFADFGDGGVEIVIPGRPVDGNEIFTFDWDDPSHKKRWEEFIVLKNSQNLDVVLCWCKARDEVIF